MEEKQREWSPTSDEFAELQGVGTLGGIECEWHAADGASGLPDGMTALAVIMMPASSVPTDFRFSYDTPLCEPSYDSVNCRMSRVDGEVWIMARAGWNLSEPPTDVLTAAIDAALATAQPSWEARRADSTPTWWTLGSCEALHERMELASAAGPYIDGWWEGSEQPEMTLLTSAGVEQYCPWFTDGEAISSDDAFFIGNTTVAPGAAWDWPAIRVTEGVEPVSVDGAEDAVIAPTFGIVYATDGVNVVSVSASEDAAVAADIAGRALSALAAR